MSLKKRLTKKVTSKDVERKGQNIYIASKICMFIGLMGIILLALVCILSVALGGDIGETLTFDLGDDYSFAYPFIALAYLAIVAGIIGIMIYWGGIYLFTLGRIAVNTENATDTPVVAVDDLPEL